MAGPKILIVNDDRSLLNARRMLLEDCGAEVFTARGTKEAVQETFSDPVDLVVIDVTNVGIEHGAMLCDLVKGIHPWQCVALLATEEVEPRLSIKADRVIYRTGLRRILVEINEMLDGRLDVSLWKSRGGHDELDDEDTSSGG